jgi:effector-binding domain-containing protein
MIVKIGVKTLDPQLVAYKELNPGESESEAFAHLNAEVHEKGAKPKEPTMIIYYDPKGSDSCHREVLVPVNNEANGLNTKILPKIKAGFIVYSGTSHPTEYYYEELTKYLNSRGLHPVNKNFCSIEAVYQPEQYDLSSGSFIDEDAQETWTTEILLPIDN